MLVKIGSAFIDPTEIAAIMPDREDGLTELEQATQICITLKHGGSFWIDATMDEAEAALIDAGVIEDPAEDDAPPELSVDDTITARKLYDDEYRWLARDKDEKLFAFMARPEYDGVYWSNDNPNLPTARIDGFFDFITSQDEEPWEIEKLLRIDV